MAYMLYQQYATAIREGYAGHPREQVERHAARARSCLEWLQSLEIAPSVRSGLVAQFRVLEEAFHDVMDAPGHDAPGDT